MIRISEVIFPPDVEEKLWTRHKLTTWEVLGVIHDPDGEAPRWDDDPKHGGRAIVRGYTRGNKPKFVYVALRPIDWEIGIWACITAFVPDDEQYGDD